MNHKDGDKNRIFEYSAIELFRYQYQNNSLYQQYCQALHIQPEQINDITAIPFLPISFFKTHKIKTGIWNDPEIIFESSGTTGETPSVHLVKDKKIYIESLLTGFKQFYGQPAQYTFLALLPSYLERKNASLVYMVKTLMEANAKPENSFYLHDFEQLHSALIHLEKNKSKALLIGVTFALLDYSCLYPMELKHTIVMETGGMKGRKEELTRTEVHDILKKNFKLEHIHAEYGMTELLSQAYSTGSGLFECSDTMRVLVRELNDPFSISLSGNGGLNIIDLSNKYSCAFIETEDLGIVDENGKFEVTGRIDHSALRGCSLMAI